MTKIIVTNGHGRPKNPYKKLPINAHSVYPIADILKNNELFEQFEQSVQYHEAPGITQSECEAELVWQERVQYDFCDSPEDYTWMNCNEPIIRGSACDYRQIWFIKSEKEERKEMTEQQLIDQPKEQVIERQFNNNCDYGFKQRKVNMFIRMAFESGFENGMNYQKYNSELNKPTPPVSKEEWKTAEEPEYEYLTFMEEWRPIYKMGCYTIEDFKNKFPSGKTRLSKTPLSEIEKTALSYFKSRGVISNIESSVQDFISGSKYADQQLSSQKAELQECYKILVNAMNLMCESDNERMSNLATTINEFLHIDPHDPTPCKLTL